MLSRTKSYSRGLRMFASLLLFPLLGAICHGDDPMRPDCSATTDTYSNSFMTYLNTGAPVARFTLNQTVTSYPVNSECPDTQGEIQLQITSAAPIPVSFTYNLQGLGATGLVVWSYNGVVNRLSPGETVSQGVVANSPVRVDIGARAIFTSFISNP